MKTLTTKKTGEWHPHIHMFALVDQWIDQQEFSEYWHSLTGDSMVVDVRRARKEKGHGYSKAAAEVCKYALKFGDLSVEKTWEAFKILKGKRLTGSFGLLWGVKIPETMTDDLPDDKTLPFTEMLYRFVYGQISYYDLIITRDVKPKASERLTEEEGRRRRDGAIEPTAPTSKGRKKQHWQIPPITRVRVRQRIKRWDGYTDLIDSCRLRLDMWFSALGNVMTWHFFVCKKCNKVMDSNNNELTDIKNTDKVRRAICGICLQKEIAYLKQKHLENISKPTL